MEGWRQPHATNAALTSPGVKYAPDRFREYSGAVPTIARTLIKSACPATGSIWNIMRTSSNDNIVQEGTFCSAPKHAFSAVRRLPRFPGRQRGLGRRDASDACNSPPPYTRKARKDQPPVSASAEPRAALCVEVTKRIIAELEAGRVSWVDVGANCHIVGRT